MATARMRPAALVNAMKFEKIAWRDLLIAVIDGILASGSSFFK
jgi:hypothetical protein